MPSLERAARHDRLGRPRQRRAHRLLNHELEPGDLRTERRRVLPYRLVPRLHDSGEPVGIARQRLHAPEVRLVERVVRPHGRGHGAEQEPQIAPVHLEVLELEYGR